MSFTKNVKKIWNYVNELSNNAGIPGEVFFNDKFSKSVKEACNLFARNLELVSLNSHSSFYHQLHLTYEQDFHITIDDILKAIKSLENKKTTGPDDLSEFFIKQCANTLLLPLFLLFNKSLSTCTVPDL